MRPDTRAIIAIGSNLGDARENVLQAMKRLEDLSDCPVLKSSLWRTTPVECPAGSADFINAVVALRVRAEETPETLLAKLQAIEKDFGRKPRQVLNEPRPLDLDLIAFGVEVRSTEALTLPHPRAAQRRFVLQPLREIAPDLVVPGQTQTVVELLDALPPDPGVRRL